MCTQCSATSRYPNSLNAINLTSFEYEYVKHIFELQVKMEERALQLFLLL